MDIQTFDADGCLIKAVDEEVDEWEITIYEYDGRGLVTKETNALGAVTTYTYDGNGNLVSKKDAEGYETEYTYNALDFVTQINYNGGKQASYRYNKVGTLVEMEDWTGTTSFEVDLLQRITQVTDYKGNVVEYSYDEAGNQTSIAYPDGTGVDYTYDLLGQLKTVTEDDGRTTAYTYDGMGRVVKMEYPHGWVEDYVYDSIGQLLRVDDTDPTQKDMKQQKHVYKYDDCGNMIYEYMRGNGTGEATTENTYTYDALNRIVWAEEAYGNAWREYQYDSLGNLTYESNSNNVHYDYKLNNLNQITEKTYGSNDKERTIYTYDKRGNLVLEEYGKNNGNGNGNGNGQRTTVGQYTYDETNKMVLGVNSSGESSAYLYNGLGALVEDTWKIAKNGYGYHSVDAGLDDTDTGNGRGGGGSNGNGNGNGNGQGNGNGSGDKPTGSLVTSFSTVVKQFVVDYTSPTFEPLMEHEVNGLDYRYVYGNDRLSVNITGVETSSGNLIENGNQIRLYYHMDYLGTTDYLTSPVSLKVTSWTHYNEWGEITHNAVLKSGQRELDLVKRYATHDFDAVLGMYYAKARFYDAENRRFASMDPVKGEITDPLTMVQYIYVVDCPLVYVDLNGERESPPSSVNGGGNKNTTTPKPAGTQPSTPSTSNIVQGAVSGAGVSQTSDRGAKYVVNATAGLNLRSTASLNGRVIMVLPNGTSVISLGQSTTANGCRWLKVSVNGQEGWVASEYLKSSTVQLPSGKPPFMPNDPAKYTLSLSDAIKATPDVLFSDIPNANLNSSTVQLPSGKPPFMPNDPAKYTLSLSDATKATPDVLLSTILNANVSTGGYMEQMTCNNPTNTDDDVIAVSKLIDKSGNFGYVLYIEKPSASLAKLSASWDLEGNCTKDTTFLVFEREIGMVKIGGKYDKLDWSFAVLNGSVGAGLDPEATFGISGGIQLLQLTGGGDIPLFEYNGYVVYVRAELNVGGVGGSLQIQNGSLKIGYTPGIGANLYISVRKKNE